MQSRIKYQVLDQASPPQPIKNTMTLRENLREKKVDGQTAAQDQFDVPVTASGTTEADGTFVDNGVGACATGPFTVGLMTQDLFIKVSDTVKPTVRTNGWAFSGKNGCGTMQNGVDVAVTVSCP